MNDDNDNIQCMFIFFLHSSSSFTFSRIYGKHTMTLYSSFDYNKQIDNQIYHQTIKTTTMALLVQEQPYNNIYINTHTHERKGES